jgi:hypothetical protein
MTALIESIQVHLAALPQVQCGWLLEDPTQSSSTAASSSSQWRLLERRVKFGRWWPTARRRVKFDRWWLLEAIPCPGDPKFIQSLTARSTSRAREREDVGKKEVVVVIPSLAAVVQVNRSVRQLVVWLIQSAAFAKCNTLINKSAARGNIGAPFLWFVGVASLHMSWWRTLNF